jgi:ubiquinone/menaquinone biosynthesis C-methylase UbiE
VTAAGSPFTDPAQIQGPLYATAGRLARRTGALHQAKVRGRHAGQMIADLAADAIPPARLPATVMDLGCGRGTTAQMLAERLPGTRLVAVDLSGPMLNVARRRLPGGRAAFVRADFHRLPLASASCDAAVAAFCLYHSASPGQVIGEIARCLRPGGIAILATKSAGSYRELDHLMADARLDPDALTRPSLYQTAHSANLAQLTSPHLSIEQVISDAHEFVFSGLAQAAEYLVTSPKYQLPAAVATDPAALSTALRQRLPDGPVAATSTVTYITARRPIEASR